MMKIYRKILFVFAATHLLVSCQEKEDSKPAVVIQQTEADIIAYSVGKLDADVNKNEKTIKLRFPDNTNSADGLVANFTLSSGAKATINNMPQQSGQTVNNFEKSFNYTVTSGDTKTTAQWQVSTTNNNYTQAWGLGGFQKAAVNSDRTYSWYVDQGTSGKYAGINCGPASTTMVAKWSDGAFTKSAEDARAAYRSSGGWWYTSDIHYYLNDNNIPNNYIGLGSDVNTTKTVIKSVLDEGKILILCLDAFYISPGTGMEKRVGKFYNTNAAGWGHFIVVKGYREVDGDIYFESYDPFSFGAAYNDGNLKGKDRFYTAPDLYKATSVWWNYAIVVREKGAARKQESATVKTYSVTDIPHKSGR
jgi:hypothetical protein